MTTEAEFLGNQPTPDSMAAIAILKAVATEFTAESAAAWTGLSAVLTFDDGEGPEDVLFLQLRISGATYWASTDGTSEWSEDEFAAILESR